MGTVIFDVEKRTDFPTRPDHIHGGEVFDFPAGSLVWIAGNPSPILVGDGLATMEGVVLEEHYDASCFIPVAWSPFISDLVNTVANQYSLQAQSLPEPFNNTLYVKKQNGFQIQYIHVSQVWKHRNSELGRTVRFDHNQTGPRTVDYEYFVNVIIGNSYEKVENDRIKYFGPVERSIYGVNWYPEREIARINQRP